MQKRRAELLAEKIVRYWANRGCTVSAKVVQEPYVDGAGVGYTVRTNLRAGLPADATNKTISTIARELRTWR